ncbi:hypothetical protein NE865_01594 [Phthorimaea operculella]|nr:hypothetical protein NE865_01594 [Phthorimaea operculella]
METNIYSCTRTGRTISEKTMEDGNIVKTKDERPVSTSFPNIYNQQQPAKLSANGHDLSGEHSTPPAEPYDQYRAALDAPNDDKARKRINPLRIHLGKRPFVDNSPQSYVSSKKKKPCVSRPSETSVPAVPRAPKLIPKRLGNKFHNVTSSQADSIESERNKPVPRLVPKSQLLQFKKGKAEKGPHLKEYAQNLGLQPMVKFKCRKCCSMSFKTLAMLKEHQLVCRAQAKEPALSPEAAPNTEAPASGPSRVTRKVYLCSACGTYYENWNLFLHMREIHNRHICLFCLGMFSKAEKLAAHLTNKHNVKEFNYNSKEDFFSVYNGTLYLMCCVCDEISTENDDFFNHDCNNVIPRPVPVLVNKNAVKSSSVKQTKSSNEQLTNGPTSIAKDTPKLISDKKQISDAKADLVTQIPKTFVESSESGLASSDTSGNSESSLATSRDHSTTIGMAADSSTLPPQSPVQSDPFEESHRTLLPNGDEDSDHSDDNESPSPGKQSPEPEPTSATLDVPAYPIEKEREGIKLKLSLNNANSPVIINSTVDPTVGQQPAIKPPTRPRRPPKRLEKGKPELSNLLLPRTPTIKMTICDKADNSFVKTTIYENDPETTLYSTDSTQDSTLRTLLNNNLEMPKTPDNKPENAIKTTIYDNKIEKENSLNRVPKLTVRVPKELLDKDSSSDYSSDSDVSDKLTVDENNVTIEEPSASTEQKSPPEPQPEITTSQEENVKENEPPIDEQVQITDETSDVKEEPNLEPKTEPMEQDTTVETTAPEPPPEPELPAIELTLDKPLDKYPLKDLVKVFLSNTLYNCIYCNHARKIAVNCEQLALHMVAEHRFRATVDSITAEELFPDTISAKVKVKSAEGSSIYINLDTYDSEEKFGDVPYDYIFECFQCYFKTPVHKDLYLHNRKMHQKTILLCVMCKSNFYSYSELLCHLCPGTYDSEYDIKFRCCLCNVDNIPSSFRLMVHLRKIHHTCDVCLEFCHNQARLSNHVWKHKLHHLCYRCGIAYRNKPDITNHLFWKHGTQSVLCKRCLQKKWPHVYHFCTPPAIFVCEECSLQFTRAVYLKVHKRFHAEEFPHVCTEEGCTEKFVSKKLLAKHVDEHRKKMIIEDLSEEKSSTTNLPAEAPKESIPVIDLVDDNEKPLEEAGTSEIKAEANNDQSSKKSKKKKLKDKDALLLDVNLPELNLSESDSSDESDSGAPQPPPLAAKVEAPDEKPPNSDNIPSAGSPSVIKTDVDGDIKTDTGGVIKTEDDGLIKTDSETIKSDEKPPPPTTEVKKEDVKDENPVEDKLLAEKPQEEIPEDEKPNEQKVLEIWDNFKKYQEKIEKPKEKTPPLVPIRKHVCESDHDYCLIPTEVNGDEDNDKKKSKKSPKKRHGGGLSSSSSSSSDSDSSCSCGSNCSCSSSSGSSSSSSSDSDSSDESGNEKKKTKIQKKRLASRRLSDVDVTGASETPILIPEKVEPPIAETDLETTESDTDEEFYDEHPQKLANKMYAEKRNQLMLLASVAPSDGGSVSEPAPVTPVAQSYMPTSSASAESKRASKRRRVPNKFYGYSSDEEGAQSTTPTTAALKPTLPPKLEWRKEDLPSPVTHKAKKEIPSTIMPSHRLYNCSESIRLTAPVPDPEPPRILMNSDVESSDSDSSDEGGLEIYQPAHHNPIPPPSYLNSGTSSLPYAFQRPAVRQAREGESVYCYCRCPYDEVSEMIACDAEGYRLLSVEGHPSRICRFCQNQAQQWTVVVGCGSCFMKNNCDIVKPACIPVKIENEKIENFTSDRRRDINPGLWIAVKSRVDQVPAILKRRRKAVHLIVMDPRFDLTLICPHREECSKFGGGPRPYPSLEPKILTGNWVESSSLPSYWRNFPLSFSPSLAIVSKMALMLVSTSRGAFLPELQFSQLIMWKEVKALFYLCDL